jgi:hypothetical protein
MFKKILIVMVLASFCGFSYADEREDWDSEMGLVIGPVFNIKNSAGQFAVGLVGGGKYLKYGINYSHFSETVNNVSSGVNSFKPYFLIEIPFSFDIASRSQLILGPMIDFGPSFSFASGYKVIDVMQLGYGLFVKYYFTNTFGLGMTPFHMTNSFATYTTGGGGFVKQSRMTYDLFFSILFRW